MGTPGNKTLPADGSLTPSPTQTVGDMQTDLENWLSGTRMMLGGGVDARTIASGSITPTLPYVKVDTEAAAASDDLDFMVQTNYTEDGRFVILRAANDARTVVVRHNITGSGKFLLANGLNFSLDTDKKYLMVVKDGTTWVEIGRFFGPDGTALRTFNGYGSVVTFDQGNTIAQTPNQIPSVDQIVGRQSMWVPINEMVPASVNGGAAIGPIDVSGTQVIIGNVADGSQLSYVFQKAMPKRWNGGTITYEVVWTTLDASANSVTFGLQAVSVGDNEPPGAYGTAVKVTDANNGVLDFNVTAESAAVTIAGTPSGNREVVLFRLSRYGADGTDTLAATAGIVGIKIFYTTNVLTDA